MPEATHHDLHVDSPTPSSTGRSATGDLSSRAAGWGALTFAVVVIAQNVIRGAFAPGNGASAAKVLSDYSGDGAIPYVLAATYVVSGVGMAVFLGGVTRHLLATSRRGWAMTGVVGAIGIMIVFTLVVAAEQALTVVAHMDRPDLGALQAVWALHNSTFTVLDLWIAIALLGLSRAAVAAIGRVRAAGQALRGIGDVIVCVVLANWTVDAWAKRRGVRAEVGKGFLIAALTVLVEHYDEVANKRVA